MTMKKYPIGIQTFEKLRNEGYLYIDKTAQIMKMVHSRYSVLWMMWRMVVLSSLSNV